MIILIIMLLFAVAADLLIMAAIYKKILKDVYEKLAYFDHDQEESVKRIKRIMVNIGHLDRRIDGLCREIDQMNNERSMPDLPFPEVLKDEEIPTDDYYPDIDDFIDDLPYS